MNRWPDCWSIRFWRQPSFHPSRGTCDLSLRHPCAFRPTNRNPFASHRFSLLNIFNPAFKVNFAELILADEDLMLLNAFRVSGRFNLALDLPPKMPAFLDWPALSFSAHRAP